MKERLFESVEQNRDGCFSEVEVYYDARSEAYGTIEWEIIDSIKNKMELGESTKQCNNDCLNEAEIVEEKFHDSMEYDKTDRLSRVGTYYNAQNKINAIAIKKMTPVMAGKIITVVHNLTSRRYWKGKEG